MTRITDAILAVDASPLAREEGARLVQAYVEKFAESDVSRFNVLDVERPWSRWIDDWTLLVGVKDAKFEDADGPLLLELKTHREPRRTKAGEYYKGDGPDDWLKEISTGIQLGIYAFDEMESSTADSVRVMVRATLKSSPVDFWPPREFDGIFHFERNYLRFVRNALIVRAAEIRAARATGVLPHDWTGYKCTHMFGRDCPYFEPFCSKHLHPVGRNRIFSETDPGAAAIEAALAERQIAGSNERLVILSASAYEEFGICREKGRITQDGLGSGDDSEALAIGSCFHAGAAELNRQIQAEQNVPNLLMPIVIA